MVGRAVGSTRGVGRAELDRSTIRAESTAILTAGMGGELTELTRSP